MVIILTELLHQSVLNIQKDLFLLAVVFNQAVKGIRMWHPSRYRKQKLPLKSTLIDLTMNLRNTDPMRPEFVESGMTANL